jgi:hypothetical protein
MQTGKNRPAGTAQISPLERASGAPEMLGEWRSGEDDRTWAARWT